MIFIFILLQLQQVQLWQDLTGLYAGWFVDSFQIKSQNPAIDHTFIVKGGVLDTTFTV